MTKKPLNPQVPTHNGRTVVNRDWMAEHTGASRVTVNLWYAKREVPEAETGADGTPKPVPRHPEEAVTIDRVDFYDQEQFFSFYIGLQERKKEQGAPHQPRAVRRRR
jgi:hypothetical protein